MQVTLARISLAVLVGLGLALLEGRALWGYWFARPSLCRELDTADRIVALSMLAIAPNGEWSVEPDRRKAFADAERFCQPDSNECREGRLISCLKERVPTPESVPELRPERYASLLRPSQIIEWEPGSRDPRYQQSSRPVSAVAIHFRRDGFEWLLVGYRTSELANDRYAYGEILFRIGDETLIPVRRVRFLLDIAGLEGLAWPVLWPANALVVAAAIWFGGRFWRRGAKGGSRVGDEGLPAS